MRALVTGAAGFVGRHMTRALLGRGWDVARCDTVLGWDAYAAFAGDTVYDLVVHAAAVEPHRAAIDTKPMHRAENLRLDAAMFAWAVRTGQRRVVYLSSPAAYPVALQDGARWDRLTEEDIDLTRAQEPDAAYGWTKLTGERMAAAAASIGLAVHVVRPFSGYGEDQREDWPFGAFTARARRREDPFVIWGDGSQVRDWIHIDDVVAGTLAVVDNDVREPVNLCTGVGTSMVDLVRLACKVADYSPVIELHPDKPTGVQYRVGDPTRMNEVYTAEVSLDEGVRRALAGDG